MIRTDERECVEDTETETAADVLAFGCFQAELEGGLAADFFFTATVYLLELGDAWNAYAGRTMEYR